MTLQEIADAVGGTVHGDPEVVVDAPAYVDNRRPVDGGLFVAIAGERVDGHDYAAGAHAVLGTRPTDAPTVVVADSVVALGRLARHVLDRIDATVLAMTGSQGKTGTKDYLAHVLGTDGETVATAGNNNNEIGVPLTVLRATSRTRYLVVEMGARGIGHISYLCEIAPPRVAAVLNVGTAHVGEFGSREAIARAKGEIVEALPADGTAVLNAGDDLVAPMADRTGARVLTFGGPDADVRAVDVEVDDRVRPSFGLGYDGAFFPVHLLQSGLHQVENAGAAAAMALAVGLPLEQVADALGEVDVSSPMRMEVHERADGLVVVNDAYNANPASTTRAVETLWAMGQRQGRRTVAVLGEMRELGDTAHVGHAEVGQAAGALGVDVVVVVGEAALGIVDGLRAVNPKWTGEAIVTAGRDEARAWVRKNVAADDIVLVKASNGVGLWVVADDLLEEGDTAP
ncbi:UDP-N-acetylmuramoyl-tripeptide--D-alanyl-D-alanine ligase [Nocardioides mangrovi]|uniref:UDP-N-acetylmuramoyl-tripeptide--D-alanyl-D-alanine ligase n=1 Tax=Nocardioides mangrovi TaxID=2874580 RepID=A0ABS7U754_9ACTN|nr:UDP-N-acetylmuramoyl-tripeptide--D-alanyl-D-alanine ligase [Nocardioides mangrovi]MBZ5736811.1 UDP-N-acetylmuramoyl-tripeptide--D-alanyl-D-alanine ligase [Nocardioides mangrovi]